MEVTELKPGVIIRGAVIPEPIPVVAVIPERDGVCNPMPLS
ncbi:hypothetical protein [uncultured Lamprocystis sp.]|jgi:hypothetical protein|nr:hypothetical protein [uncultured Lamprocystis sp.]